MHAIVTFGRPILGKPELDAIADVLARRRLTAGGKVKQFEERFEETVGGGKAVAVSSCFAALYLFWLAKGIGPGDEVICPALTHVATAHAIELTGARPVFVDCHPESGNVDQRAIEMAITPRTKGVCVVHYLGIAGYLRSIADVCRKYDLPLLEDCALALGTRHEGAGVHVGLVGDAGCFSFYPAKHITTGEGGMFLTKYATLADRVSGMRRFGLTAELDAVDIGGNFRMTEMQAAMGVAQLDRFPGFLEARESNSKRLHKLLEEYEPIGGSYAVSVKVPDGIDRDAVRHRMNLAGVETAVYYRHPVPDMPYYWQKYGEQACPVAREFCYRRITLPVHSGLKGGRLDVMALEFRKVLG